MLSLIEFRENDVLVTAFGDNEQLYEFGRALYKLNKLIGKDVYLVDDRELEVKNRTENANEVIKKMEQYDEAGVVTATEHTEFKYVYLKTELENIIDEIKLQL